MTQLRRILAKARALGFRRVLARLRPRRIDLLLFELFGRPNHEPIAAGFALTTFTSRDRSGIPEIDRRLSSEHTCYVLMHEAEIAHVSWLFDDVVLPAAFGFDAMTPVIGDCDTPPKFRGRGLYPLALRRIASDVLVQRGRDRVYILVAPTNAASIRGIERAGGVRVARLQGTRLAGLLRKRRRS